MLNEVVGNKLQSGQPCFFLFQQLTTTRLVIGILRWGVCLHAHMADQTTAALGESDWELHTAQKILPNAIKKKLRREEQRQRR